MKIITSFMSLSTGEGSRIAYTYSEISEEGNIISQNNKGNFLIMNAEVQAHVDAIREYISTNKLED